MMHGMDAHLLYNNYYRIYYIVHMIILHLVDYLLLLKDVNSQYSMHVILHLYDRMDVVVSRIANLLDLLRYQRILNSFS